MEETAEVKSGKRKPGPRPRQTWDNLPVLETRMLEPGDVDHSRYRRIGEETTYLVGYQPGKLYRIAIVRPKYGLIDSTEPVEGGEGNYELFFYHLFIQYFSLFNQTIMATNFFIIPYVRTKSASIKESSGIEFLCPANTVMTGRYHKGDENGSTQYEYATLKAVDEQGNVVQATIEVTDIKWSAEIKEFRQRERFGFQSTRWLCNSRTQTLWR